MPGPTQALGAAADLGLGGMLGQQTQDETEEEKRRRKLGLTPITASPAAQQLFGFGQTGVGAVGGGI